MNRENNSYTLIFASVMVIIVALILSLVHEALKDTQQANVEQDKMSQILSSIHIQTAGKNVQAEYNKIIKDVFLVDEEGNQIPNSQQEAFYSDMKKLMLEKKYPVFVANIDGGDKYIMALSGKGLWGDLWGYIAVNADGNTIYGADFSHASETPGLGAEISTNYFSDQFTGKQLFRDGKFTSIAIVKPGKADAGRDYVDGISGGTITGNGVDAMLYNSLEGYSNFLKKLENK